MAALKIPLVFLIACCAFATAIDVDLMEVFGKCGSEIGIDKETLEKFNATRPIQTDNEKIKCYLKCVFQETGWMTPDGEIEEGEYEMEGELAQYKQIVEQCLSVKGDDACDTAFVFHKCVIDKKEGN